MMKSKTIATIIAALFFAISTVQAINSDPIALKRSIGYAFLGLAFSLAAIAYASIFITRRREKRREKKKDEVEAVVRIYIKGGEEDTGGDRKAGRRTMLALAMISMR